MQRQTYLVEKFLGMKNILGVRCYSYPRLTTTTTTRRGSGGGISSIVGGAGGGASSVRTIAIAIAIAIARARVIFSPEHMSHQ